MSQGINAALRGVRHNIRDEIRSLHLEGWVPQKTNGGHIRLQHPSTDIPVFCSSTPSDPNAHLFLRRDCRNALAGTTRLPAPVAPVSEEELRQIMRARKAADKPAPGPSRRRASRQGPNPSRLPESVELTTAIPDAEEGRSITPSPDIPVPETGPSAPVTADPAPERTPTLKVDPKAKKEKRNMNAMTRPENRDSEAVSPSLKGLGADPSPVKSAAPPRRQPEVADRAPQALDPNAVEYGMQLGLRVASGELKLLRITPDMVGKILLFTQEPIVIGEVSAAAAPVAKTGIIRRNVKYDEMILAFIKEMGGKEVPVSLIGEHMAGEGAYKPRSAQSGVRQRLERLAMDGRVLYRAAPGEPCASLID